MSNAAHIVSKFFLDTCRRRQATKHTAEASTLCAVIATKNPFDDDKAEQIPLVTGSAAEFYINPMLPCIGDVDVMFYDNNKLAIPAGYPPPTELPDEFHDYVKVVEIIDSDFPGYVYLNLRYLLTVSMDEDTEYHATQYEERFNLSKSIKASGVGEIHGPADSYAGSWPISPYDRVWSTRCLLWPTQACDWAIRHRSYGWPDSATVNSVTNSGCDIVCVAHRQSRPDERMWRLSFSRAEVVLLNSWMPVQQIVYHMIRTFVKTEKLTEVSDNCGSKIFSNYQIKTLMLWACEKNPRTWWTDGLKLVKICVELLHTLAVWFNRKCCQHYFISNCNLMDVTCDTKTITGQFMSVSESWLAVWFINKYIYKCAQICNERVAHFFDDVSTVEKLQNAALAVVYWRRCNKLNGLRKVLTEAKCLIARHVGWCSLSVRSCVCWMTELPKTDKSLSLYFIAVAFLHLAIKLTKSGVDDTRKLLDILATVIGHFVGIRTRQRYRSLLSLSKALEFMKVVAINSNSTLQLIEIELSKAYLYRALTCDDSTSNINVNYCILNVYLGVMCYTTGQYQTAIDHCKQARLSEDHSQCSSHVVQGDLLPKIDDCIDSVLGLSVFYQHVKTAVLNQQQHKKPVNVFTTGFFAHCLLIKCLSAVKCRPTSLSDEVQRYRKYLHNSPQLFTTDVLLHITMNNSIQLCYCKEPVETNKRKTKPSETSITSELVELLQQSAVEHLTAYRHLEVQQLGSVVTIVTTDYEALYSYKRGDYLRCLQLSTQNVRSLFYRDIEMQEVFPIQPVFVPLLDNDIVSLTALTLIVNPECRELDGGCVCISQLTLSLYLMTQCQLKLRHSVTSLAQTLDDIEITQRRHRHSRTLDHLTLKLIERKLLAYLTRMANEY